MPHVNLVEEFFAMMAMLALTELQSSTSSYTSEPLLDIISAAIHRIHGRELREMSQNNLLERTHSTINLILARRHGYLFFNAASATRPTTSATNTASRSSSSSFGLSQLFVRGRTASTRPGTATREGTSSARDRSRSLSLGSGSHCSSPATSRRGRQVGRRGATAAASRSPPRPLSSVFSSSVDDVSTNDTPIFLPDRVIQNGVTTLINPRSNAPTNGTLTNTTSDTNTTANAVNSLANSSNVSENEVNAGASTSSSFVSSNGSVGVAHPVVKISAPSRRPSVD